MSFISIVFAMVMPCCILAVGNSGWYIDSGYGQTVMDEPIIPDEMMQANFIDLLGIKQRLQYERSQWINSKPVPKFLLQLYRLMSKQDYVVEFDDDGNLGLIPRHRRRTTDTDQYADIILQSDTIMTFMNDERVNPLYGFNDTRLAFDITEAKSDTAILLLGELHLYKDVLDAHIGDRNRCIITIYGVRIYNGLEQLYPIYIHNTIVEYEGWIRINVTDMASDWMKSEYLSNILYFTVHIENNNGQLIKSIKDTKFILGMESTEHQPFITAFFQNHIKKRVADEQKVEFIRRRRSASFGSENPMRSSRKNPFIIEKILRKERPCQRLALYISFSELALDDVIIGPPGYGAFYCKGGCSFSMVHRVRQTNHAIVQNLARILDPDVRVPEPCCAPISYEAITVIYSLGENRHQIKKFPQMVANECACQ